MTLPTYGAAPLAKTFLIIRGLQILSFLIIIGITAHFVDLIVSVRAAVPREIVGTLTVTCVAALYTLITVPFFYAEGRLTLFIMAGFDFLLLIAFVVVAVVLGRPLSYLNCFIIGDASSRQNAQSALAWTQSLGNNLNKSGNYVTWIGATQANCIESKSVWGISIGLCILFACSVLILPALFFKQKRAMRGKSVV